MELGESGTLLIKVSIDGLVRLKGSLAATSFKRFTDQDLHYLGITAVNTSPTTT